MTSRSWNLRGGVVNPPPLRPNAHKEYEGPRHLGSTNTVKIIAKIGNRCHPYIQKVYFQEPIVFRMMEFIQDILHTTQVINREIHTFFRSIYIKFVKEPVGIA